MARGIENANTKFDTPRGNLSGAWRNHSSLSQEIDRLTPTAEAPGERVSLGNPSRNSYNDRNTIVSNTRNIAALAARKRNKAQTNLDNIERRDAENKNSNEPRPLYRPTNNNNNENKDRESYLTPSRLDKHNRTFVPENPYVSVSKAPSDDSISITTKHTVVSERSLPPLRQVGNANGDRNRNVRQWVPVDSHVNRKKKRDGGYTHQVGLNLSLCR